MTRFNGKSSLSHVLRRLSSTFSLHDSNLVSLEALPVPNKMPDCTDTVQRSFYVGSSYEYLQRLRRNHLTPNMTTCTNYKRPLVINSGQMQWLFDHENRRYLDLLGGTGTISVGHCHPKVSKALDKQMKKLWHTTNIYWHPKIHEYARRLTAKLPNDLNLVYFVNSGSEANDLAMKLVRLHTDCEAILTLRNSNHGTSPYVMGLTAQSTWRFPLAGVNNGIIHVMNPDPYQGIWGGQHCRDSPVQVDRSCVCTKETGCTASTNYYKELEETFKYSLPRGQVAAMFAESIQGVGGTVQFPQGYIKKAAELVRANGGLLVTDEVQTGFGRTGEHYWGFEGHGVVPDIVTIAKGITNGFPMAAVIMTSKIAQSLGMIDFNTYSGNPMASAVGIAVLDVIEEEQLQLNSLEVGTYFLKLLAELRDRYEIVGDVRGKGLMIGLELVSDRHTRAPLSLPHVKVLWENCKDMGILFGLSGLHQNVIRIRPPMCIDKSDAKFAVDILDYVLSESLRTYSAK